MGGNGEDVLEGGQRLVGGVGIQDSMISRASQLSRLDSTPASSNSLPGSQSSFNSEPGQKDDGCRGKRGYIPRGKFFSLGGKAPAVGRRPRRPRVADMERTEPLSACQLVRVFEGASQLMSDCSAGPGPDAEFEQLVVRSLSNRCRNESTRARVCRFAQYFVEFALYRPRPWWSNGWTASA